MYSRHILGAVWDAVTCGTATLNTIMAPDYIKVCIHFPHISTCVFCINAKSAFEWMSWDYIFFYIFISSF